ncbi:hypothetical protein AX777_20815 [Sphingobium yanoikuyae]|uniref:Uncharacterized protein n=1 Tax=Sphingobium yanoikuyae TaxID=13690 RepID=A0A177JUX3_SPHYA|nr:hypothetical protein AX777_20815 [Sphingobium yanoikuyae]
MPGWLAVPALWRKPASTLGQIYGLDRLARDFALALEAHRAAMQIGKGQMAVRDRLEPDFD